MKCKAEEDKIRYKGARVYNILVVFYFDRIRYNSRSYPNPMTTSNLVNNDPYKVFEKTENFLAILGPYSS